MTVISGSRVGTPLYFSSNILTQIMKYRYLLRVLAGVTLILIIVGCGESKVRLDFDISGDYEFMTFERGFEQESEIARQNRITLSYTNGLLDLHSLNLGTNGTSQAHFDGFRAKCEFRYKKPNGDEVYEIRYTPGYGRFLTNSANDPLLISMMSISQRNTLPFLYLENYAGQWTGAVWKKQSADYFRIWDVISKKDSKGFSHTLRFDMHWRKKELSPEQKASLMAGGKNKINDEDANDPQETIVKYAKKRFGLSCKVDVQGGFAGGSYQVQVYIPVNKPAFAGQLKTPDGNYGYDRKDFVVLLDERKTSVKSMDRY